MNSSRYFILSAARDQAKATHGVSEPQDIKTETECCHEGGDIANDASVEPSAEAISHGEDENSIGEDSTETVAELLAKIKTMMRNVELGHESATGPSQDEPENDDIIALKARIKRETDAR
jgi:hypothetical protein